VAQFLCKAKNDEEVLAVTGAFLQLYREEGWYLERTCHYIARVGLDHVKKFVVEDKDSRKRLYERLLYSLADYKDPWADAINTPAVRRDYEILEI